MVRRPWRGKPLPIWWRVMGGSGLTAVEWVVFVVGALALVLYVTGTLARDEPRRTCPPPNDGQVLVWYWHGAQAVCQYVERSR